MSQDHWEQAQRAAALLAPAWRDPAQALAALPDDLRPASEGQAYAIQQATAPALGRIGGWKVGAPSPAPDAAFACAPMPLANFHAGHAHLPASAFTTRIVEAEICLRLDRDLDVRDTLFTATEVLAAVGSCHPAIEVLQSRFQDPDAQDKLTNLADMIAHGAFIYGPAIPDWQNKDWTREEAVVTVNGREAARQTGNPGGEMIRMLVWLANVGARWAGGLRAGQFITTGSWTGKTPVPPGGTAEIGFATSGQVMVTFG